ncbi:hypothetical protein AURDEDRAFT_132938 [Auricularia subglabra TFB-10046 SS5]|nr:hypothetical protein AURDEDRAFT_132938 [Auricularia subglabra TFB-10046 SS5]
MYKFATVVPSDYHTKPDNTIQYYPRAVIDTSLPGQWTCTWVPPAKRAQGVPNEGVWPRIILLDGEQVVMQRDEWDTLKLHGTHNCQIPQKGYPTATRMPGMDPRASPCRDVPELDSDSDASSVGTATPHAVPSTSASASVSLANAESLRPGTPMRSVVSRLYTAMSIDTSSLTSKSSSNLAPNDFGKRPKAADHDHLDGPPAKRHHKHKPHLPKTASARARRQAERDDYKRKRQALAEERMQALLRAEAELRVLNIRAAEEHKKELEEKHRRIMQMDADELAADKRFKLLEKEREEAEKALTQRRMKPETLAPQEAYKVWERRVVEFGRIRGKKDAIHVRDIPFPVLFRPEYSLHLVDEKAVAAFFTSCTGFMTKDKLKKTRIVLHDTQYRGKKYTAGAGYMDEADTEFVVRVMTRVAAYVNDRYKTLELLCQQ